MNATVRDPVQPDEVHIRSEIAYPKVKYPVGCRVRWADIIVGLEIIHHHNHHITGKSLPPQSRIVLAFENPPDVVSAIRENAPYELEYLA